MDKRAEYEQLASLERETTQMRHTTFTALISISFIVPGFASQGSDSAPTIEFFGRSTNVSELAFLLGFFFYIFTVVHYTWYHRYSHMYRSALKKLEVELGIEVYRLRVRPRIGRMKFHFDWCLYILGVVYAAVTTAYVGIILTAVPLAVAAVAYLALLLWSIRWPEEPLE